MFHRFSNNFMGVPKGSRGLSSIHVHFRRTPLKRPRVFREFQKVSEGFWDDPGNFRGLQEDLQVSSSVFHEVSRGNMTVQAISFQEFSESYQGHFRELYNFFYARFLVLFLGFQKSS